MKRLEFFFVIILIYFHASFSLEINSAFEKYKAKYAKAYSNSREESKKMDTFEENIKFIEQHNSQPDKTFTLGINSFVDMTQAEFIKAKTGLFFFPSENNLTSKNGINLEMNMSTFSAYPESLDYRKHGIISRVMNQGYDCGSCGFFGDMGSIEGVLAKRTGKLIELSKQHPGDCAYGYYAPGREPRGMCDGQAWFELVFDYIRDVGAMSETDYPYIAKNQDCQMNASSRIVTKIKGHAEFYENYTEEKLKAALYHIGPIAMSINAGPREFSYYKSGIYRATRCEGYAISHRVVLIGYGNEGGDDFWIFKNSWGTNWGEDGYIRIATDYKMSEESKAKCFGKYELGPYLPVVPIFN